MEEILQQILQTGLILTGPQHQICVFPAYTVGQYPEAGRNIVTTVVFVFIRNFLLLFIGDIFSHVGILKEILERHCHHQYCSIVTILMYFYVGLRCNEVVKVQVYT